MKPPGNCLVLLLSFLMAFGPFMSTQVHGQTSTPVYDENTAGLITEFAIDELPGPTAQVFLLRTTIGPDWQTIPAVQHGPMVLLVESGTLMVDASSPVVLSQSGEDGIEETGEITLQPGQSVLVPAETRISYATASDETVELLILLVVSTREERQGQGSSSELLQVADNGLAIGMGNFQPIAGMLKVERVIAQPGQTMDGPGVTRNEQTPGWMGVDIGLVETGSADLEITQRSFESMIWADSDPNMFLEPRFVTLTATETVSQGDGYAFYDSELTWKATGDEPLTIVRAVVMPVFRN